MITVAVLDDDAAQVRALLCEENGKYAALWNAQAQYYAE